MFGEQAFSSTHFLRRRTTCIMGAARVPEQVGQLLISVKKIKKSHFCTRIAALYSPLKLQPMETPVDIEQNRTKAEMVAAAACAYSPSP